MDYRCFIFLGILALGSCSSGDAANPTGDWGGEEDDGSSLNKALWLTVQTPIEPFGFESKQGSRWLLSNSAEDTAESSTVTVAILFLLLFLLIVVLFLACRKLNRDTGGHYYPSRFCRSMYVDPSDQVDDEGGDGGSGLGASIMLAIRRVWDTLLGRGGSQDRLTPEDRDETESEPPDEQERDSEAENSKVVEQAEGSVDSESDDYSSMGGCDLQERAKLHLEDETLEPTAGTSSEGLLSDLHSFSGTASWADDSPSGAAANTSEGLSDITAL
ncbi:protein tyrosine phosphatase receptor type C-associated protein [Latimeria chalumnae]|uniref:protein tyrosine phosphatase receptor type C-associated protein n=1 Tax=Latimeria chalumnae TaxID=7897 RepID=UPI0006D90939|nr:PREDICTED: protein tyrosine phosphatase receptor type C-associated protein [Latimeria chalumnae]|eukprot:XP_005999330.2 PREDICTED: protein tyrosine phosphatase receptor type C-associated protein [Latimeria chalumnae]